MSRSWSGAAPPYPHNHPTPHGPAPAGLGGYSHPASGYHPAWAARRPGTVVLSLVLHVLSALPYLALGVLMLLLDDPAAAPQVGGRLNLLVGGVLVVVAGLYLLFAVLAFRGGRVGRVVVILFSLLFCVLTLIVVLGGGFRDGYGAAAVYGGITALSAIGSGLLLTSSARFSFAHRALRG